MKISLNHLNKLFSFNDIPLDKILEELSLSSCEIESVELIQDNESNEDAILDVISTANRGDLLSYIGLGREISALIKKERINLGLIIDNIVIPHDIISFNDKECLGIITGYINNIQSYQSPLWLQQVLSINGMDVYGDINDTINYVMLETGFPLLICNGHLSTNDLDIQKLINNQQIIFNKSNAELTLRGILFSPQTIRKLSKKFKIKNDITQRYERSITSEQLEYSYRRALHLIKEIHGASINNLNYSYVEKKFEPIKPIIIRASKIISRLGKINNTIIEINSEKIINILYNFGFNVVKSGEDLEVSVPYYRQQDVQREIDLVEEIGRVYGFNNFIDFIPRVRVNSNLTSQEVLLRKMRSRLKFLGFNEFINYSLIPECDSYKKDNIELKNPLTTDFSNLRQTLLYSILNNISYNLKTSNGLISAYEIGRLFAKKIDHYEEQNFMSLIITGQTFSNNFHNSNKNIDWFHSKGIIEELLSGFLEKLDWEQNKDCLSDIYKSIFHPYNFTTLFIDKIFLGIFGQLHPKLLKSKNINYTVYALEINIQVLLSQYKKDIYKNVLYKQYSLYPYISRDITFNVDKRVMAESIRRQILIKDSNSILTKVELISIYADDKLSNNYKNISFRLYYQASDRTLTVAEVDNLHNHICSQLDFELA